MGENMAKSTRNHLLDLLRGIAILIVVLGHAIQVNLSEGNSCFLWSRVILAFQMPLLFFISGYAAGFSFPSRNPIEYIRKKAIRLLIPYLSWEIIHYFIVACQPNDYRKLGMVEFIKEFFVSDFWFLRMLFVFFIIAFIANIVMCLIHQGKNTVVSAIVLIVMSCSMIVISKVPLLSQSGSLWYYMWFVFGYILFHLLKKDYIQQVWINVLLRRVICGGCIIMLTGLILVMIRKNVPSKLVAIIFCLVICVIISAIEPYMPVFIKRFCITIGKNTLPIYAIHWCLLFSPFFRIDFYIKLFSGEPLFISSIVTASVWMIICILSINLLSRVRMARIFLLGEK